MKIEWTETALSDLKGIRDYIARDSDYYAARFAERIIEAIEGLENFPKKGRRVPEAAEENILEILFQSYRIIYRVEEKRVLILTIVHGARDFGQKKQKPWEIS